MKETRMTILIIDDSEVDRQRLKVSFEKKYNILEAENGLEGLQKLEETTEVDLIILDIIMPRMDGVEFVEYIKKDERLAKIPIIVNTQKGKEKIELSLLKLGINDFVTKSTSTKIIEQKVENIISQYVIERQLVEQNLRETTERLETLIDTVPGGI